ncbi:MAG: DMT family transporter [Oscillospiraceae bacterium]
MKARNLKGALMLLVASLIWGTAFVAQSMGNSIGPFTFNAVRNFVGVICLVPVILFVESKRKKLHVEAVAKPNRVYIAGGVICGVALFGASSLQQIGLQFTSAGKAGFLTALYIVIVPILGLFFKKKVGVKIWISVGIAAVGTYLLSVKEGFSIEIGDVFLILCALVFSVHILLIDRYSPLTDAIKLSAMQFLTCAVISAVVALIFEHPQPMEILQVWGPILYAGIMSSSVAFTLQVVGQRDTPPAVASLIMSLESVFAVLAGWVILNEQLAPKEMFGCALVFLAVILAQIPSFGKKKKLGA